MTNAELIEALRNCSNEAIEMCPPCKYFAWDKPKDDCKFEMMRDAADAIERLTAQVPAWISVEERLPDYYITVLVCGRLKYDFEDQYQYFVDAGCYDDGWETYNDWNEGQEQFEILYWMPLPVPPDLT